MKYTPGVTMVIPTIPPRIALLNRAIKSIAVQTEAVAAVSIAYDTQKQGANITRTRALRGVTTEWCAFLDDDDELLSNHIALLYAAAKETESDVVWPWFEVVGGTDPFPGHRGHQLDPDNPHIFPITTFVRTEFAHLAEFPDSNSTGAWDYDDWPYWRTLYENGAKFHHIPDITWRWHHDSRNTSGRPDRW